MASSSSGVFGLLSEKCNGLSKALNSRTCSPAHVSDVCSRPRLRLSSFAKPGGDGTGFLSLKGFCQGSVNSPVRAKYSAPRRLFKSADSRADPLPLTGPLPVPGGLCRLFQLPVGARLSSDVLRGSGISNGPCFRTTPSNSALALTFAGLASPSGGDQ